MEDRVAVKGALALGVAILAVGCVRAGGAAPPATEAAASNADEPSLADVPEAADAPEGADAVTLDSKVAQVTVYSDRARVTRRAIAQATDAPQVFAFRKLPGWVDDGSVRVSASAGRIADVRVERSFLARSTDESYRKAEQKLRDLSEQLAAVNDDIAVLDAQKAQIEAIKAFSLDKVTKDTTTGAVGVQSYGDVVKFISDELRDTAKARRDAVRRQGEIAPRVAAAQRALDEMQSLLSLEETTVFVTLQASRAAASEVELTYMMPGATWEPMHEIRVSTSDAKAVEVASFAVVTQTSGEDWDGAELSFSTQSTTESVRIPELEALTLGDTQAATRVMTSRMSSFSRAQQAFAGQNELWNKVQQKAFGSAAAANFEQVYQSNMEYLQVAQSKTVQIFETLKNRGTTEQFKALAAQRVSGDGHPTRLRIGTCTLKSEQKIVAVPEQSLNAVRTLEMENTSGQSLLPGKVALYQDGAFVGLTDIDFVAQGERFPLYLGVADNIKLTRVLDRKQSSLVRRQVSKMVVTFVVTAENLQGAPTSLTLADRIPVSEDKEIKVSSVKIAPAGDPDSQGILRWDLELKPKEKKEFRISYQVEYPPQLILDARRRHAEQMEAPSPAPDEAMMPTANAPMPMPSRAEKKDIGEQLFDLEASF